MRGYYRQTKIVGTVGLAAESSERLRESIVSGVELIRLNMAGIDFVALSFVRKNEDVVALRALLDGLRSKARTIARIEDQGGLRNLEGIAKAMRFRVSFRLHRPDPGLCIDRAGCEPLHAVRGAEPVRHLFQQTC